LSFKFKQQVDKIPMLSTDSLGLLDN